ncbi:uracil-DNA glycosylase [Rhodopila globiformis]|uniref:Type-5 uracil-DNA glycosylase n=1 Tax=Rhodopila globiformis TaxID=1071 RepID=A0A2S6MUM9_RHOGL|nr:uracil-DNA glycosylase [Rhodopila globiformis]
MTRASQGTSQGASQGAYQPAFQAPAPDCRLCPRLAAYRDSNRAANPGWYNGAVPSFGPLDAAFLVVGLAPGVRGANRTGRPFTGDYAGVLLYETLLKYGFAHGSYAADPADGMALRNCRVTNAVRCVPPANLPRPEEIRQCNPFLTREMAAMPQLRVVLALGGVAHKAVLQARGLKASHTPFVHGAVTRLPDGLLLADSYHVSRLNTSTGRLTTPMFQAVISDILAQLT